VTLSDLAKYSTTRSLARSLRDSWAFVFFPLHSSPPVKGGFPSQ